MKRTLPLFVALPLLSSCYVAAAGAVGAAGYVLSRNTSDYGQIAQVAIDVDQVWPSVKQTMEFLQEPGSQATFQDFPRVVDGRVDGAKVRVEVEAMDLDRTTIRVTAETYLGKNPAVASDVLNKLLDRLAKT